MAGFKSGVSCPVSARDMCAIIINKHNLLLQVIYRINWFNIRFEIDKSITNHIFPIQKTITMTYFGGRWSIALENKLHGAMYHIITGCMR